jgi:hypothetical protein
MASTAMVLDSLEHSNLPAREKSQIRKWVDNVSGGIKRYGGKAKTHLQETGQVMRGGGEALLVGGLLGAAHAELKTGLDVKVGKARVPVDGVVAVVGLGGAVLSAGNEFATDLRNSGQDALAILSFRKTHDWIAEKKIARGEVPGSAALPKGGTSKVHGDDDMGADDLGADDMGADPVESAARSLR